MMTFPQIVSCDCGQVEYQAKGEPIVTAVCYCTDCQAAAALIMDFQNPKPFCELDGGTPYVTLLDKDWTALKGADLLHPIELKPNSLTTRYITTCCHSPMFLKFKFGFWTSTYRERYNNKPPLEWRNKTGSRQSELLYADDIPRFKNFPLKLFGRLIKARLF